MRSSGGRARGLLWPGVVASALCALAAGCEPAPGERDAHAADATLDAPGGDGAALDADAIAGGALFDPCDESRPCGSDTLCLGAVDGYPGGMCSRMCTLASECGPVGTCAPGPNGRRYCMPACAPGVECPAHYRCFRDAWNRLEYCRPFCDETECGAVGCNLYTGFCGAHDPARADTSGECTRNADCRSAWCGNRSDTYAPNPDLPPLRCNSVCVAPPPGAYDGAEMPRSNCPPGAVCSAQSGNGYQIDLGWCQRECRTDADCPVVHSCFHPTNGAGTRFANGYCMLTNCAFQMRGCPAGWRCVPTMRNPMGRPINGYCVVDAADGGTPRDAGDASADGAVDARDASGDDVEAAVLADGG